MLNAISICTSLRMAWQGAVLKKDHGGPDTCPRCGERQTRSGMLSSNALPGTASILEWTRAGLRFFPNKRIVSFSISCRTSRIDAWSPQLMGIKRPCLCHCTRLVATKPIADHCSHRPSAPAPGVFSLGKVPPSILPRTLNSTGFGLVSDHALRKRSTNVLAAAKGNADRGCNAT